MPATRRAAALAVCLAATAVTACGARSSTTLPVVAGGFGSRGDAAVNVTGTDTLVFVIDILAATRG
jgi:hypothetical protein